MWTLVLYLVFTNPQTGERAINIQKPIVLQEHMSTQDCEIQLEVITDMGFPEQGITPAMVYVECQPES